ncbi:MAG: anaerobic ribonucleoside-triphosphate reductase activating protein [Patescibacteria group bacterium]
MIIAGLQKLTLIDYPGKVAAVLFTYGCNFACAFCHNPELVDAKLKNKNKFISEEEFFKFLNKRQGLIEGVCITGGEPTLHQDLPEFIAQIKALGFLVKLDSNGTNPPVLKNLISKKLVDYIAMDIKAPLNRYQEITRRKTDLEKIKKSIRLIIDGAVNVPGTNKKNQGSAYDYEFRSTLVPGFHETDDVRQMAKLIKGAKKYYLQNFISQGKILESSWQTKRSFTKEEMEDFQKIAVPHVDFCGIRM